MLLKLKANQRKTLFLVSKMSFRLIVSPSFTSKSKKWQSIFFWNHNVISLTISCLACKINNKGNLSFLSVQQWLTISIGSSPKLSTDSSVNAGHWVSSKEIDLLIKTLRITNKSQIVHL